MLVQKNKNAHQEKISNGRIVGDEMRPVLAAKKNKCGFQLLRLQGSKREEEEQE